MRIINTIVASPSRTPTHRYSVSVSNITPSRFNTMLNSLPSKYLMAALAAELDDSISQDSSAGSSEQFFHMSATAANALRKWFKRRHLGRSKFSRVVVNVTLPKSY